MNESLHKCAINVVLLHPFEMKIHRGCIVGAEDVRRGTVRILEWGFVRFLVFRHLGPKVDAALAGCKFPILTEMPPLLIGAVARGIEPTRIARHRDVRI